MNSRATLALAVAGGYVLGRTKKAKLALSIGGMVLGRRLQLDPQRLLSLVDQQLKANPQLGELREQLREDLGGVGRAAAGAFLTRRIDGLADSLHERTLGVQDRIGGATAPVRRAAGADEAAEADDAPESRAEDGADGAAAPEKAEPEGRGRDAAEEGAEPAEARPRSRAPRKKAAAKAQASTGKTAKAAPKSAKGTGAAGTARGAARRTSGEPARRAKSPARPAGRTRERDDG